MTRTIVASATREIIIGFDQPFCVIGERINPTGRKKLAAEMIAGNFETVIRDALEQAAAAPPCSTSMPASPRSTRTRPNRPAGADAGDRPEPRRPAAVDRQLGDGRDRSRAQGCQGPPAGQFRHRRGRKARSHPAAGQEIQRAGRCHLQRRDRHFDGSGRALSPSPRRSSSAAPISAFPPHDVVVDPLVMPIGALGDAGRQVFALLRRLREELKVNTTCGLSNISFGLPHRHGINAALHPDGDRRRHDVGDHEPGAVRRKWKRCAAPMC
jgi:5-methyltetrahydrofolate--homocysteine methyltransferase